MTRNAIFKILSAAVAAMALSAGAGEVLTGDAAVARFPAGLRSMGLGTAKWMQLTNGVEYYYGRFSNLLGTKNDLHMLRIDYAHSPVRMKFVDHTQQSEKRWTTSRTAAAENALFAINMTMEDSNGGPQGYAKADGVAIPSRQEMSPDGFAFNDDKSFKFDKKWLDVNPETGKPKADAWDNIITLEAYTLHNGVKTWSTDSFPRANYPFFGSTADGILWVCVVDGRREGVSDGLSYYEIAMLQFELGCVEGVCCDGGGSTTMAIRKDLMTASDICDTQKTSADSSDYYTMNYLSGRQKDIPFFGTITIEPVGTERKVINQLVFVEAPYDDGEPIAGNEKIVKDGDTIVFMGDSITWYGARNRYGYVNLVMSGLAANNINATGCGVGVKGDSSTDMLSRFEKDVIPLNPDVVTISAGVNDVWFGKATYDQFLLNETEMVEKTRSAGAKPVVLSPTTAAGEEDNADLRKFASGAREIAAAEGIAYADTFNAIRGYIDDIDNPRTSAGNSYMGGPYSATCDGVHMAPVGDREMARAVLKSFGLDATEMANAEAAWNADESLIPVSPSVNLTAAEYAAVQSAAATQGVALDAFAQQVFLQGIESLTSDVAVESEAAGADAVFSLSDATVSFSGYDKLLNYAKAAGCSLEDAKKAALLRGVRHCASYAALEPTAPVVEDVVMQPAATTATLVGNIVSVGACASSCDVLLAYGTDASSLGAEVCVLAGQRNSFVHQIRGLATGTTYHYKVSVANNAPGALRVTKIGNFTTSSAGNAAIQPSGVDDTAVIQSAIDAVAPLQGVVSLDGGTFLLSSTLNVTGGVALVGRSRSETTLKQTAMGSVVKLDNGSSLRSVTVTGGRTSGNYSAGGGAYVNNGTISDCRIVKNIAGAKGNVSHGGGVYILQGTVDHSVIERNQIALAGSGGCGAGVGTRDLVSRSEGATIDTCLIRDNVVRNGCGGGVGIDFAGCNNKRTIRNTTIVNNRASAEGGGLHLAVNYGSKTGFAIVNCIVAGNSSSASDVSNHDNVSAANSSNNLFGVGSVAFGTDCIIGVPAFVDAPNGDFHPVSGTAAVGAGKWYDGIVADLDGCERGNPPNVGCYESCGVQSTCLGEAEARPGTDYNGSSVSVAVSGIPDGATVSAKVSVNGVDYVGVVDAGVAYFDVPAVVVTAGNVYAGTITLTVDGVDYTKDVSLVQGSQVFDEKEGWIRESAAMLGTTGAWSGAKVAVADGRISVSNAVFSATAPSRTDSIVTISSTLTFGGANDDAFSPLDIAGVKVVKVADSYRYAFLTDGGVVTNLDAVAKVSCDTEVQTMIDPIAGEVEYIVGGTKFGPFPCVRGVSRVSAVSYSGECDIASLTGAYRFDGIDTNLAASGGIEYATVAEAVASGSGQVELLWDTSWSPASAGAYTIVRNGFALTLGGSLACQVTDNGDGTITVTVAGGAAPESPRATSVTFAGSSLKVGVSEVKAGCWYALEKTSDLSKPFAVDESTWVSGASLLAGTSELSIVLDGSEPNGFYRVVVSTVAP